MSDNSNQRFEISANAEDKGARLDRFLAAKIGELSRTRLKALILEGEVEVSGRTVRDPEYRVNAGDEISVSIPEAEPAKPAAENIPLDIVYEDKDVIVIDKPAGLVVHPAAGNRTGTLVNALIAHCGASLSGIGGEKRPGIVHRLDKDTSGLLVVAKNDQAHRSLSEQFADHGRTNELSRGYIAFTWGAPKPERGTIDAPIARDPRSRVKMAVKKGGKEAVTHYEVLRKYPGSDGKPVASMIECELETGRTHQIRVHLAKAGHPLLGDAVYGAGFQSKAALLPREAQAALAALNRQALHAYRLAFSHPRTGKLLSFESKLPKELAALEKSFKKA
ncbi:MAG: RluA family pseudouridine synthase [Xanthobacteraceae bacterium]|nr:RluA family pseudouridine synthase [Xanthobacteraceae bacterium]MCW5675152.1 RluA family pseudouridine synthase [Xanthobacteraceae bacterium]